MGFRGAVAEQPADSVVAAGDAAAAGEQLASVPNPGGEVGVDGVAVAPGYLVGAENSSTLCDLGILMNEPAQSIK